MNIDTGDIRKLDQASVDRSLSDAEVRGLLKAREMLLPAKGPLSASALLEKSPEDRLRILKAQAKRERRAARNLRIAR